MLRSNLLITLLDEDLVMRHPLTESLATLPTGQTATEYGSISYTTYGGRKCAYFPAGDYIRIGSPFFDWENGFTYMAWCYYPSAGNTRTMVSSGDGSGAYSMSRNGSSQYNCFGHTFSYSTIGTGDWHHIAASLASDGLLISIYRDGVLLDTFSRSSVASVGDISDMAIGGNTPGFTYNTRQVYMSDARIYSPELSASRIAEIYNSTL